jgi:restriction system protein
MSNFWMVRAGERGYLVEEFERSGHIGIGWNEPGDFSGIETLSQMRNRLAEAYPDARPGWIANAAGMTFRFRNVIQIGDTVVTYDPQTREYLLGTVVGDYAYNPGVLPDYNHVRRVQWESRVSRDDLSPSSRNTLGSTLTLFAPGEDVLNDIRQSQRLPSVDHRPEEEPEVQEEWQVIRRDVLDRAREFIKDRMLALAAEDMELLVAGVLRAMGYKARVTPRGPDRGRDVIASPDGLGFQQPRIIAEVKHRPREAMGSPQVRGFLGGLRGGDRGLYVSTGGFTREARYEADRASVPVTLVDLDELADLVVEHYERFDSEGRGLLPLIRVYWPAA